MSKAEDDRVERVALAIYDAVNPPRTGVRLDKAACISVARVALEAAREELAVTRRREVECEDLQQQQGRADHAK